MTEEIEKLPWRRRRFVEEYVKDNNGAQAAIRAGYSARTARSSAHRLLTDVDIRAAVDALRWEMSEASRIDRIRIIEELAHVGFADMRNYICFGEDGNAYLDWQNMPVEASRAIESITQEEYIEGKGDLARDVRKTRFRLHNKLTALVEIAKLLGLSVDKVEHSGLDGGPIEIKVVYDD